MSTAEWPWRDGSCPLCHSTDRARTSMRVFWKDAYLGDACEACVSNMRRLPRASPPAPVPEKP